MLEIVYFISLNLEETHKSVQWKETVKDVDSHAR